MVSIPKSTVAVAAIVLFACLVVIGIFGNFLLNWRAYVHQEEIRQEKIRLEVTCLPVFDESVEFCPAMGKDESMTFFTKCFVLNSGPKKVFITRVGWVAYYSMGDDAGVRMFMPGGATEGRSLSGGGMIMVPKAKGIRFAPDEVESGYMYNHETKKLELSPLPLGVESGEQVVFFVKTPSLLNQDLIRSFAKTCPERLARPTTLREVFTGCMGGEIKIKGETPPDDWANLKEIVYLIAPQITVFTADGQMFTGQKTIAVVKLSGSMGTGGTMNTGQTPSK